MKVVVGYRRYVEEEITIPKEFEFVFEKDEDDFTDEEWEKLDEWSEYLYENYGENCEIIS